MGLAQTIDALEALRGKIALRVGAEAAERIVGDFVDTLTPADGEGVH
jgi:hypothetical protein